MGLLASPTLTELLADVRNLLNQPTAANSFWTDAELTSYINESVRRYFTEVVQNAEGQFDKLIDLNIVTDVDLVALPSDFFEVKNLYKKVSNGYTLLPYDNNLSDGYTTQGGSGNETFFPSYYFRVNNLVLRPVPNFSETSGLRLEYISFPDTLVSGSDTMTTGVSPVFKDLIIANSALKAKIKESSVNGVNTHAVLAVHVADLYNKFKEVVAMRSYAHTYVAPFNPESE